MLKLKIRKILEKNEFLFNLSFKAYRFVIDLFNGKTIKNICSYIKVLLFHRNDKNLLSTIEDGLLRIRITEKCNAKCKFCRYPNWNGKELPAQFLYNYLNPIYKQLKSILISGGDSLIAKESFNFAKFICENYQKITLIFETNGIAFDEKWQDLVINNLILMHFSINGSNEEVYQKSCWDGEAGKFAYRRISTNFKNYINKLIEKNLEFFTPSISMVINEGSVNDVYNFVKFGLVNKVRYINFYFDFSENDILSNKFSNPNIFRPALQELMKIERVLAKKIFVFFRLYMPLKELNLAQSEIEKIPIEQLRKDYVELLDLAKDRDMKKEYEKRQDIRKKLNKKTFTFEEDFCYTLQQININNKKVCYAPFKELDIYPNGMIESCGWIQPPRINLNKWIKNDSINWQKLFNSTKIKKVRYDMLNDNFTICQRCCPLNSDYNEICEPHKFGYDRQKE